ncbi:ATP-binding protein [Streptomyces sp. NPDC050504]|uniref:sensor histidine kinase n=1 Tax=Streptomyces sp. NPDC050504 TaxID=3365618 RepID=UPI0037BAF96B
MRLPVPRPRSLAGQLFAMQVVLVAAIVAGCALFGYVTTSDQAEETARRQATATATAVAMSPSVVEAAGSADPTARLQAYAERLRTVAGVDFVVVMAPDGTRWTHPVPGEIGRTYLGRTAPALRGETFSETHLGVLGPSVRTVAPVFAGAPADRRVVALVSAGITIDTISEQVRKELAALGVMAALALALGGVGTYVINARLRRHTHGMNAGQLSRMHDYHQATLHAVREGLLMLDGQRRIALLNDGARELLGLGRDAVGRPVTELDLPRPLAGALLASEPRVDEVHMTADRVVVVNTQPVYGGERRGTVVTLRDHTELQALSGELDSERGFSQALRAQAHEAANRLHTVVSLIELGRVEEAVGFATAELELAQALTDQVVTAVGEPVLAALLLGKAAQANERGVELVLTDGSSIEDGVLPASLPPRDLVTILGNLIDNAVDAAQGSEGASVTVTLEAHAGRLLLAVADSGPGVESGAVDAVFELGWSTKSAGRGLGLALVRMAVARHGGSVTLDRGPEGGAEFTVLLPLDAPGAHGEPDASGKPDAHGGPDAHGEPGAHEESRVPGNPDAPGRPAPHRAPPQPLPDVPEQVTP